MTFFDIIGCGWKEGSSFTEQVLKTAGSAPDFPYNLIWVDLVYKTNCIRLRISLVYIINYVRLKTFSSKLH